MESKIPGLSLLETAKLHSATKEILHNSVDSMPKTVPYALPALEDWLAAHPPEPTALQQQQKKAKPKSEPHAIVPIAVDPDDKTNWVGQLHNYWNSIPEKEPGTIKEEIFDLPPPHLFHCTITTSVSPKSFGGPSFPCLKKKDAKQNAAKLAVQWLIEHGHISQEAIAPKGSRKSITPANSNTPTIPIEDQSIPAQVNHLAQQLGFKSPSYIIELVPETVAMFSGYAHFPNEPLIEGKVGEFFNVWSKKSAKERCALEVLEFLKGIERHRLAHSETEAGNGKRKLVGLESPERKDGVKLARSDVLGDEEDEVSEYGTPTSS